MITNPKYKIQNRASQETATVKTPKGTSRQYTAHANNARSAACSKQWHQRWLNSCSFSYASQIWKGVSTEVGLPPLASHPKDVTQARRAWSKLF